MFALLRLVSQHFRAANSSPQNSTETSEVDPCRCSDSTCFRIRAIPLDWNKGRLLDALKTVQPSIEETMCELALYPSCGGGRRSQTALLILNTLTGFFSKIGSNESSYIKLVNERGVLELDRHFRGLTPLNAPEAAVADVIAVAGFAGHPIDSWRHRETEALWLRDFLPKDVRNIRIMTYGCLDESTFNEHFGEERSDLLQAISCSRCDDKEKTRPIIFVGHSMGGLLILRALLKSKSDPQYLDTFTSTRQLFLFGVPHQGMDISAIQKRVEDTGGESSTRLDLVRQLSNVLMSHRENIADLWPTGNGIRIVSFYERLPSPTVQRDPSAAGNYTYSGPETLLVEKNSALLFWPGEYQIGIPRTHTNLVKFGNGSDKYYLQVVQHITKCIKEIEERRAFQGYVKT